MLMMLLPKESRSCRAALQQAAGPCDAAVHASKQRNTVLILSTTAILQRGHLLWQAYCMAASASPLPADRPTAMQLVPAAVLLDVDHLLILPG